MKIVFFGSDDLAAAHLKSLVGSKHQVLACVTRPDRPKGRGMKIGVSPVKECAQGHGVKVFQPGSLKDRVLKERLKELRSDLFVVIAYGQLLPKWILDIPAHGAINVHASLLPKYRGAAPINWAIINGEKETGITVMKMNEEMDAGDILRQMKIKIDERETAASLRAKMVEAGPPFLLDTIDHLADLHANAQDGNLVTMAPKMTKGLGNIEWAKEAYSIDNLVRGLVPWPGAYTFYEGKMLKILEAQVIGHGPSKGRPGTVSSVGKDGIAVETGNGTLLVKKVHFEGSRPMDAHSFVIGHAVKEGFNFRHS